MRPSTHTPMTPVADGSSAADTTTVSTLTPPAGASGCLVSVETTNARMTFDNTTPAATNGHVIPKDQMPAFFPIGSGSVVKWTSTAAAVSTVVITWLR